MCHLQLQQFLWNFQSFRVIQSETETNENI
jgi:hypothetical protein